MRAMTEQSYLRTVPAERLPPPATQSGVFGWLRDNLFSSPGNSALTLICIVFIACRHCCGFS
jgi:general L-amino acid transport system permease protein